MKNTLRITQTAETIAQLMGFSMGEAADVSNDIVVETARQQWNGKTAQRAFLYNPDAIALWLYQKYPTLFADVISSSQMALPVYSVMPSVPMSSISHTTGPFIFRVQLFQHGIHPFSHHLVDGKRIHI